MKHAYVAIREAPVYRREAFISGLRALGYEIHLGRPDRFDPGTVFIAWNRYHENHDTCTRVEQAGGVALIAENGYIGPGGSSPHGMPIREWFALARSYHNDHRMLHEGSAARWNALGVDLKPWREGGEHILVCPNRSFGTPGRIMPPHWADEVAERLSRLTHRTVRIRPHPGNTAPAKPLADDLAGAWACVIWASSAGVHALVAGIPVICEAPSWICKSAALKSVDDIYARLDLSALRLAAMHRLAWAQWSLAEIQSGEAFDHLLRGACEREVRAAD